MPASAGVWTWSQQPDSESGEERTLGVLGLVEIVAVAGVGMEEAKSGHAGDVTAWPGFLIIPTTASTSTKTNTQGESSSPDSELGPDYFIALKNSVVCKPPSKMQKRLNTQQALDMILSEVNPCDSDGEEINLQLASDPESSELSSGLFF
uniref:Uncharacterized protein n=1 Tax=Knipowitschia caucasica TaxID=637954 RepID=A0AAV2LEW3_KNICA